MSRPGSPEHTYTKYTVGLDGLAGTMGPRWEILLTGVGGLDFTGMSQNAAHADRQQCTCTLTPEGKFEYRNNPRGVLW